MNKVRITLAAAFAVIVCAAGLCAQAAPEIDVQRPTGNSIPDGGSDSVGALAAGVKHFITYTVLNTGTADLDLDAPMASGGGGVGYASTPIFASFHVNCAARVYGWWSAPVRPSGSTSIVIEITPTAVGPFSFDLELRNSDANEGNYDIAVSGTGVALPEIDLQRPVAVSIPSGGSDTVYGAVMGQPLQVTWTIENLGLLALDLTGSPRVAVSNPVNCSAAVTGMPPAQVGPQSTAQLVVTVTPTVAGAFGFELSIASSDGDENPYLLSVSGDAQAFAAPEIELRNSLGGAIPSGGGDTKHGIVAGVLGYIAYRVYNLGSLDLNLTGSPITVFSNPVNCTPTVSLQPAGLITPGSYETCYAEILVAAAGAFSFDVTIENDDSNENPYTFTASGIALATPGPEIDIQRPQGVSIPDGGSDTLTGLVVATPATFTYTIQNQGSTRSSGLLNLNLMLPFVFSGQTNCTVTVTQSPGPVAPYGKTTTFELEVTATAVGAFSFDFALANDDANENPYDIAVSGIAAALPAPEIDIQRPLGNSIPSGGVDALAGVIVQTVTTLNYSIENQGTGDLTLTASPSYLNVQSMSNCTVTVIQQPGGTITPASFSLAAIEVSAQAIGPFSFELVVISDDSDESTYLITVQGVATGGATGEAAAGCAISGATFPFRVALLAVLLGAGIASRRRRRKRVSDRRADFGRMKAEG